MRMYCKPEHLHSFVQGVIDATGTTEGVDVLPMYGSHDSINHYCIRVDLKVRLTDGEFDTKVVQAIHKVIDSWVTGETYTNGSKITLREVHIDPNN